MRIGVLQYVGSGAICNPYNVQSAMAEDSLPNIALSVRTCNYIILWYIRINLKIPLMLIEVAGW